MAKARDDEKRKKRDAQRAAFERSKRRSSLMRRGAALVVVAVLIAARSWHRGATHATEHMTPGSVKAVRGSREVRRGSLAGTFEVLVPVPGRNKPQKVPLQFPTLAAAENWMHSPDGREQIAEILEAAGVR